MMKPGGGVITDARNVMPTSQCGFFVGLHGATFYIL